MKVSMIHAERRCAQQIALEVVSPEMFGMAGMQFPARLTPTQRYDLVLPVGGLLAFVAMATLKQHGPAPLAIELEAEEGELLHADSLRVFELAAPPGYYAEAALYYMEDALDALGEGKLVRVPVPLALAGDRQQYGIASVEISPAHDALLIVIANLERVLTVQP